MATINLLPPLPLGSLAAVSSDCTSVNTNSKSMTGRKLTKAPLSNNTIVNGRIKEKPRDPKEKYQNNVTEDYIDPARYRNSLFHNICTSVLTEGFHEAFTELFTLVEKQREEHRIAGPAAVLLSPLIDNNEDKLRYLVSRLQEAESARRKEELDIVYTCQKDLALHFEETGDRWLADHFHLCCLETGHGITGDNRRKEGEAHLHVGLAYENRGEFQKSVQHLLEFHGLAKKNRWHADSGERLHPIACEHLRRVYTKIAEKEESVDGKIEYLIKAHEKAKESGDTYQEGMANHRLGCAYETMGDFNKAIQSHKGYLDRCRYHGDQVGVCKAYEAISRCHELKGDTENAVKFLELYVGVAEGTESKVTVAKAYSSAGIMFNTLCDYEKAIQYFSKSYNACKELGDKSAIEKARVHYGIAKTHHELSLFSEKIGENSDKGIKQLLGWKGRRDFSIPTPVRKDIKTETSDNDNNDKEVAEVKTTSFDDERINSNSINDDASTNNDASTNDDKEQGGS